MMCCPKWMYYVVLLVGVLMLGQDLKWWAFWNVGEWAAVFLLVGLYSVLPRK